MEKKPQVFINFRGKDERMKLVPYLKHHLSDINVNVFTDENATGEPLENLFKHIRNSRIVIVIFSINYMESRWCLDELVEIKKCLETEKIDFAIPIFYEVKASSVKKQSGMFGQKFQTLKDTHPNSRIKRWKKALSFVAANIGLTYSRKSLITELDFVKKVVEEVKKKLNQIASKGHNGQEILAKVTEGGVPSVSKTENSNSAIVEANLGATSVLRDAKPSSKIVTITSFSVIKQRSEPYESSVFESSGYKWRLIMYLNGNKVDGGNGYISLYVRITDTNSLPSGWEVDVDLKLFVHNAKLGKYLTVTDGATKRYNEGKKQWGFGQVIPHSKFNNANEGYIVQDTASFGAEIFIVKPVQKQEKVTFISNPKVELSDPRSNVFTWNIPNFSTLKNRFYYSDDFLVEDRYWRLGFNPKGDGDDTQQALPLYLFAEGFKANATATNTWGAVNLRLKNQQNSDDHRERYSAAWYPIRMDYGVGVNNIILLRDLRDQSKGYLVNDSIVFEAEMVKVSVTNVVPV